MKGVVFLTLVGFFCLLFLLLSPLPLLASSSTCFPTAIGCIDITNLNSFVKEIISFAIGIAGGIAFFLMLAGVIVIMTSQGKPEQFKTGQELISSAIVGLLFIIFSLFLLELIGVKILKIPDFSV